MAGKMLVHDIHGITIVLAVNNCPASKNIASQSNCPLTKKNMCLIKKAEMGTTWNFLSDEKDRRCLVDLMMCIHFSPY